MRTLSANRIATENARRANGACGTGARPAPRARLSAHGRRVAGASLATLLALAISGAVPTAALALSVGGGLTNTSALELESCIDEAQTSERFSAYSSTTEAAANSLNDWDSVTSYDLVSTGYVTPVKRQHPWGTCWAFAAIAAAESSILAETGQSYAVTNLDLSERHLAWFAYQAATASVAGEGQEGEGYHSKLADENQTLDFGGRAGYSTTAFAAGVGPVAESAAPYRSNGADPYINCSVIAPGETTPTEQNLNSYQIQCLRNQSYTVVENYYASTDYDGNPTDWSLDASLFTQSDYQLEESYILPDTALFDSDGDFAGLNQEGIDAVKEQIYTYHRAVACSFYSDTSRPSEDVGYKYINRNTWASYTYDRTDINHAVTIVGWDDSYSKENFAEGHQPEGDGAWLVKNSWGAETEDFPNSNSWGLENEDGENTGYFWISYYDHSIQNFEAFDFYTSADGEDVSSETITDQYDLLTDGSTYYYRRKKSALSSANLFEASEDRTLRSVACRTVKPNTTVTFEVYLLGDDAESLNEGTPVVTREVTYEYGGYHRLELAEDERVPMREGQQYSVVVTQYCNTDGYYYVPFSTNYDAVPDDEVENYREEYTEYYKSDYLEMIRRGKLEELLAEGVDRTEAKAQAEQYATDFQSTSAWTDYCEGTLQTQVESALETLKAGGFESRVNAHESWVGVASSTGEVSWTDWQTQLASAELSASGLVGDNLPIKARSSESDWASVETLDSLKSQLAATKEALASAKISADGTDVATSDKWLTQAEYDELSAAISTAETLLANAGDDYANTLLATTPGEDEAQSAITALGTDALKPGTKQSGDKGDDSDSGSDKSDSDQHDGSSKNTANVPQTGDAASNIAAAIALAGTTLLALAIAWRH